MVDKVYRVAKVKALELRRTPYRLRWLRLVTTTIVPLSASERQRAVVRGAIHQGSLGRGSTGRLWSWPLLWNEHLISHLWSTPVVFPFYRSYRVLRQSSAAC